LAGTQDSSRKTRKNAENLQVGFMSVGVMAARLFAAVGFLSSFKNAERSLFSFAK
jgi:hypothetical protein